jgi:hypothetical protein
MPKQGTDLPLWNGTSLVCGNGTVRHRVPHFATTFRNSTASDFSLYFVIVPWEYRHFHIPPRDPCVIDQSARPIGPE